MSNATVIHNLSPETITIRRFTYRKPVTIATLTQNSLTRHTFSCTKLQILVHGEADLESDVKKATDYVESFTIHTKAYCRNRSWNPLKLSHPSRLRVYQTRTSRHESTLAILTDRDMRSYLADVPDGVPLNACLLPGTHDTMAVYGWPFSQCQSTTLADQLAKGVRMLDIRLAVVNSALIAFHGTVSQKVPFKDILTTIHAFLTAPQSSLETVVMSIKQEDIDTTDYLVFSKLVRKEILAGSGAKDMWFRENRIPTLGEVRGKVVLFSRFGAPGDGWEDNKGIYPGLWPDNKKEGFMTWIPDATIRVHDWYGIPSFLSIPEKFALSTPVLLPPGPGSPSPLLSLTFFSAANPPMANPQTVALGIWGAEGVNSRVGRWLLERLADDKTRLRGWALMDFCDPDVVRMLAECNFRWRVHGEEGWL